MQLPAYIEQNRVHLRNCMLLLLLCILAYWPLSFGIFSVKNDAIHYFLPYRFHISEALRNGEWPFWSPYIYNGNPVMGDMQSGAWNPVVWLFSLFGRYDITLFHCENLLYIFLGGVGMYKLSNRLSGHSNTAFLLAASYLLSGFMLGGQLINWLGAAAFLPFVLHYYLQTMQGISYKAAIKTGISLYLLFTAGYPSFFILTAYLLVLIFIVKFIVAFRENKKSYPLIKIIPQQLLIILVFVVLSLPAILSYADLLPYYDRGAGTSYAAAASNAFDARYFITLVMPPAIKSNDVVTVTDITCRNIYFGLIPLLVLIALPPTMNRRNLLLLSLAVFSILFSMGDATPVREWCYRFVPLLDTFRHPSQMRLFFILAVLLLAAPGVKRLMSGSLSEAERKRLLTVSVTVFFILALVFVLCIKKSSLFSFVQQAGDHSPGDFLKKIIESVSFADTVLIGALLQMFFLLIYVARFKKINSSFRWMALLWTANLWVMAQPVLPASFVSKTSPREINAVIHASPKGYPASLMENSLSENSKDAFVNFEKSSLRYFYNKKPGISKMTNSPAFLSQMDKFIQTDVVYQYVSGRPVLYLADTVLNVSDSARMRSSVSCNYALTDSYSFQSACDKNNAAVIQSVSANSFIIETTTADSSFLVLTQNYYPAWQAAIDGTSAPIFKTNISFMGVKIPPGKHIVKFVFIPSLIKKAVYLQLACIFLLFTGGVISVIKKRKTAL